MIVADGHQPGPNPSSRTGVNERRPRPRPRTCRPRRSSCRPRPRPDSRCRRRSEAAPYLSDCRCAARLPAGPVWSTPHRRRRRRRRLAGPPRRRRRGPRVCSSHPHVAEPIRLRGIRHGGAGARVEIGGPAATTAAHPEVDRVRIRDRRLQRVPVAVRVGGERVADAVRLEIRGPGREDPGRAGRPGSDRIVPQHRPVSTAVRLGGRLVAEIVRPINRVEARQRRVRVEVTVVSRRWRKASGRRGSARRR